MPERERLFTARFALMFGFSFTVFLSAFQLLPTAPFHILSLGGSSTQAGLFLAFLTYSSATSAPFMWRRSISAATNAISSSDGVISPLRPTMSTCRSTAS